MAIRTPSRRGRANCALTSQSEESQLAEEFGSDPKGQSLEYLVPLVLRKSRETVQ